MAKNLVLCGSHGTGKSTLVRSLAKTYDLFPIQNTVRSYWQEIGVSDFEQLPRDVRTVTQKDILLRQIEREDEARDTGFITDRSVIDVLAYSYISSNIQAADWRIFEQLVKERIRHYSYVVYTPVEFTPRAEKQRADLRLQRDIAGIIEDYLHRWGVTYLRVSGNVTTRIKQIEEFLS